MSSPIKVTFGMLEAGLTIPLLSRLGTFLPLAKRKQVAELIEKLRLFYEANTRAKERMVYVYGKKAPASWPNAGQTVMEPTLMTEEEYSAAVRDMEALRAEAVEVEWELTPVTLKADVIASLTPHDLVLIAPFLDVRE